MTSIRKCGLVGVGVTLLKDVCHWEVEFEVLDDQARPVALSNLLLPTDPDVELTAPSLAPRLSAHSHISHHGSGSPWFMAEPLKL